MHRKKNRQRRPESRFRLFNFRAKPRMFCLQGDLRDHLWLEPESYRAGVR